MIRSMANSILLISFLLAINAVHANAETTTSRAPEDSTAPVRTWTDRSGKHQIEAKFSNYEHGTVELLKNDRTIVVIDLSQLSASDQSYIRQLVRQRQVASRRRPSLSEELTIRKTNPAMKPDTVPARREADVETSQQFGVDWHLTPESVRAASDGVRDLQKPVMWFRVLGDLTGFM